MHGRTWQAWLVPGGLLLALAAALVNSSLFVQVAASIGFYYVAVFAAGLLLAWRFNSSRLLFSLLVLLLAHRAVAFFFNGPLQTGNVLAGPGRTAVALAALPIPLWILLSFVAAIAVFVYRFVQTRKPIEPGFAWSAVAVFLWLQFAPVGKMSDAYVATAALILAASMIETSYVLAYHDELTGIRGRRAFNESLLSLDQQYAIAIVDIDHFKKFNDTYGHDVGDQVLCMVASRLSHVGGGGQAFRCGGEEFAIVFPDTSAKDAYEHLNSLRRVLETSSFHLRSSERRAERRTEKSAGKSAEAKSDRRAGESDRRRPTRKKAIPENSSQPPDRISVTVSIGVAEPSTRLRQPEQVIQAADQALYSAKGNGRNRVEIASTGPLRMSGMSGKKRAKASQL